MKKIVSVMVCCVILMLSCVAFASSFSDISGHWAEAYINDLVEKKVINGYPDGTYKPDGTLTYGEYFKLIVSASLPDSNIDILSTDYTHWAGKYAQVLVNYNIISKDEFTDARFDEKISRIEVVEILSQCDVKIRENNQKTTKLNFIDIDGLNTTQIMLLRHAVSSGIIGGDPEGTFRPNDNLRRSEVAKIIYVYRNI